MDYQKHYEFFYSKYYKKAELLIQSFLIKRKSQKKTFSNSINDVSNYLYNEIITNSNLSKSRNLTKLHDLFNKRHTIYEENPIQEIFANDIKLAFDEISISELPLNYNYPKFIKDVALIEVATEVGRLVSNNSRLLDMFFKLDDFTGFEIRQHENLPIEDYPIYIQLHSKLYPQFHNDSYAQPVATGLSAATNDVDENWFPTLFLNPQVYDCVLKYQKHIIDFYSDYSYLKKRLEKEKLIHNHKDNEFMRMVFEDLKLISQKNYNEYCINGKLKSLEKSYSVQRNNNFNIVFEGLI